MSLRTSYSVLSTIQASAADIVVSQGYVYITGVPQMKYSLIQDAGFGFVIPVAETLGSVTVTPTPAVGVPTTIVIQQYRADLGKSVIEVASYTPVTGDTATTVVTALTAQINLFKDLWVTVSGSSTLIITATASQNPTAGQYGLTGSWGSAIIEVSSTSGNNVVAPTTAAIAITGATTATPVVVSTGNTTGLVAGGVVSISGLGGMPEANGTFIIGTVVSNTSFAIDNFNTGTAVVGVGTYTSGGSWVLGDIPPTSSTTTITSGGQSRGYYWDLVGAGVNPTLLATGNTYNQVIFNYDTRSGTPVQSEDNNRHTLYSLSNATNFAAFKTRMVALLADLTSGGAADPLNLSVV